MSAFQGEREAKEFLVSRIVEEARRENVPLSDVERKMLYFSETNWTLPDIAPVSEAFDREYDQDNYEKKITRVIREAAMHDRQESPELYNQWWNAIRCLKKGDHYILVMIDGAVLPPHRESQNYKGRHAEVRRITSLVGNFLIIFVPAFVLCFLWLHFVGVGRYEGRPGFLEHEPLPAMSAAIGAGLIALFIAFIVLRHTPFFFLGFKPRRKNVEKHRQSDR